MSNIYIEYKGNHSLTKLAPGKSNNLSFYLSVKITHSILQRAEPLFFIGVVKARAEMAAVNPF
jgi:hypothetical protein